MINTRTAIKKLWTLIGVESLCLLGSEVSRFGVSVWIYRTTHSVTDFSLLIIANSIPGLLIAPIAGSVVDRFERKKIMIGANILALTGTLIVFQGAMSGLLSLGTIAIGAALASIAEGFQWPAITASLPLMASEEDLPRFNGLIESGRAISMLAGPALGGLLFGLLGLSGLLGVEISTFLIGTLVVASMVIPSPHPSTSSEIFSLSALWDDCLFGVRWIFRHPALLKFLGIAVFANFFINISIVLMPPYCMSVLSDRAFGVTNACFGAGMVLGGIVYGELAHRYKNLKIVLVSSLLIGVLYIIYGFLRGGLTFSLANLAVASLMTAANAGILTIWQVKVPEECAGRVLSAVRMIAYSTGPLSYLLAGPLADQVMPRILLGAGHFSQWARSLWGAGKTSEMGLLFSLMGILLFIGFLATFAMKDLREVDAS